METFLVTGSGGCIGSWVVTLLAQDGQRCVALDLSPEQRRLQAIAGAREPDGVSFVTGDITRPELLDQVVQDHGVTRIIHLAALQIPLVKADPVLGARVNVVGTVRVLEAARRHPRQVRNVVYASSAAAFGPPGRDGAFHRRAHTLYGVFKACNEDTAFVYGLDWGVPSVGLRPWAVFGPGRDQGLTAAPTHAMRAAAEGVAYRIPFGGRMDLQYVEDVARAFILAALTKPAEPRVYNLQGTVLSMDEVVAAIQELWPAARGLLSAASEPVPIPERLGPPTLDEILPQVPLTDFREAVRRTLEHFSAVSG